MGFLFMVFWFSGLDSSLVNMVLDNTLGTVYQMEISAPAPKKS